MLKKKSILEILLVIIFSLGLVSCKDKEKTKTVTEMAGSKNITIGENLDLYNGMSIAKISLIEEKDGPNIIVEFKAKNLKELEEYNLKIHAFPLLGSGEKRKTENWDISLKKITEKDGKYYVIKKIDTKVKEYELNIALFKIEKTEDGMVKYPNFGNQLFLNLKL